MVDVICLRFIQQGEGAFLFFSFFFFFFWCGFWFFVFWSKRHMTVGPRQTPQLCFEKTDRPPRFRELETFPSCGFCVPTRGEGQVQVAPLLLGGQSWSRIFRIILGMPLASVSGTPPPAPAPALGGPVAAGGRAGSPSAQTAASTSGEAAVPDS